MIAILPAGGRGTRMTSVTRGMSKEALPLGGRTVLDHVLDEAFAAGAERAVVVGSRDKSDVEAIVAARSDAVDLRFQDEPKGLAHAIVAAREFEDDALVLLPDTLFAPRDASRALAVVTPPPDAAILVQTVSEDMVSRYGIVETEDGQIRKILEKPNPTQTASRLAIAARFWLTDRVLRLLDEYVTTPIPQAEYDLTSGLNRALLHTMTLVSVTTSAERFDCGSPEGYRLAMGRFGR